MLIKDINFAVFTVVRTLIAYLAGLIHLRFSGALTTTCMMMTVLVTTFTNCAWQIITYMALFKTNLYCIQCAILETISLKYARYLKYYKEATMDYRLRRLIKPGFYRLIPAKKLCPGSRETLDKLEQGGIILPVKLVVSVTFVPLPTADCGSIISQTESSPSQKQQGKWHNTANNTNHYLDVFLLCIQACI